MVVCESCGEKVNCLHCQQIVTDLELIAQILTRYESKCALIIGRNLLGDPYIHFSGVGRVKHDPVTNEWTPQRF